MSPSLQLGVLALASTAMAAAHNNHARLHHRGANAPAPYPVPGSNSTGIAYSSGSLPDTCTDSATSTVLVSPTTAPAPPTSSPAGYAPSPYGGPSSSAYVSPAAYPSSYGGSAPSGYGSQSSSISAPVTGSAPWSSSPPETCAPVTVTATGSTVTVTVTAGDVSSAAAPPSYDSETAISDVAPSKAATEVTTAPAVAPTSTAAAVPVASSKPKTSPHAPSPSSSSGSGKRGLAYNDVSLTSGFMGKPQVSWAYNWGSTADGLDSGVQFVPLLHSAESVFTDSWSVNAQNAINAGSKVLFSFNEPDASSQADLSPAAAAQAYRAYMQPFAGKADLCAPSVTNGAAPMGLSWLQEFLDECSDCTIDCLNIHWYASGASAVENFQDHLSQASSMANGKSIWVSEFALNGADAAEQQQFAQTVMPMMDNNSQVAGYAYYWVAQDSLVSGSEPSALGQTYADFVGST